MRKGWSLLPNESVRIGLAALLSALTHSTILALSTWGLFHSFDFEKDATLSHLAKSSSRIDEQILELDMTDNAMNPVIFKHVVDEPKSAGTMKTNLDMQQAGKEGSGARPTHAVNLADRDDGIVLSDEVRTNHSINQLQRIRSNRQRNSREDIRSSREPMQATFVAMGKAKSLRWKNPMILQETSQMDEQVIEPAHPESELSEILKNDASVHSKTAKKSVQKHILNVSLLTLPKPKARPWVKRAAPSVHASTVGKPSDTVDSDQQVATAIQSLLHASTSSGTNGMGEGGQFDRSSSSGSGGTSGAGFMANPVGSGGDGSAVWNSEHSSYERRVFAKISPLWQDAFPAKDTLAGRQGHVAVVFDIYSDGTVGNISVKRPSGIVEFDHNCQAAIVKAAPFEPLPPELGHQVRLMISFDVTNPAVLPKEILSRR